MKNDRIQIDVTVRPLCEEEKHIRVEERLKTYEGLPNIGIVRDSIVSETIEAMLPDIEVHI